MPCLFKLTANLLDLTLNVCHKDAKLRRTLTESTKIRQQYDNDSSGNQQTVSNVALIWPILLWLDAFKRGMSMMPQMLEHTLHPLTLHVHKLGNNYKNKIPIERATKMQIKMERNNRGRESWSRKSWSRK